MKKLFKVRLGKPTGGGNWITYSYNESDKLVKSEYFVVAKSFNEAGKMVMEWVAQIIQTEKSPVRVTEFGLENISQEYNVSQIELITDELIIECPTT